MKGNSILFKGISIFLLLFICYACPFGDDDDEQVEQYDLAEFYETENDQIPIIAIDQAGTCFGIANTCVDFTIELSDGDLMNLHINDENLPESILLQRLGEYYLIVFSEFSGETYDLGVVNLSTEEEFYFTDLVMDGANDLRSSPRLCTLPMSSIECKSISNQESTDQTTWDFKTLWEDYGAVTVKTLGQIADGAMCGVSIAATAGSFGAATGVAVITCGTFVSSLYIDLYTDDELEEKKYTKGVKVLGSFGNAALKCTVSKAECIKGVASNLFSIYSYSTVTVSENVIDEVRNKIKGYKETGGLVGKWDAPDQNQGGVIVKQAYIFNADGTGMIHIISENDVQGTYMKSTFELNFRYGVSYGNTLTVEMTTVRMHTLAKQNGITVVNEYSDLGTYSEFVSEGNPYAPNDMRQTWSTTYKIYGGMGVLDFEDGTSLEKDFDYY